MRTLLAIVISLCLLSSCIGFGNKSDTSADSSTAQEEPEVIKGEHLSFMDIPVAGSLKNFCKQLEAKEFRVIGVESGVAVMDGLFLNENARVYVYANEDKKDVYRVCVVFNLGRQWLEGYNSLKELYTEKYGTPESVEKVTKKSYGFLEKDYYYYREAFREGQARYSSVFTATGGTVEIFVGNELSINVVYTDKSNADLKHQENLKNI